MIFREDDVGGRARVTARTLNRDVWRLCSCENFVGK